MKKGAKEFVEFQEFISDSSVLEAFNFILGLFNDSKHFNLELYHNGGKGKKDVQFHSKSPSVKNYFSPYIANPFSFIVNKKWLNFYIRFNHHKLVSKQILQHFPKENYKTGMRGKIEELSIKLKSKEDVEILFKHIFNEKLGISLVFNEKYKAILNTVSKDITTAKEENEDIHTEGKQKKRLVSTYERSPKLRAKAIEIHGYKCKACGFDFYENYGELGKDFIEVHHVVPLFSVKDEITVEPETDLVCLCSNCHRMIHRVRDRIMSIEELRKIIDEQ